MTTTDLASHDGRDLEGGARVNTPIGQLREELFGPVLTVQVIGDDSEASRVAQDTPHGLAAAAWTDNLGAAHRICRALTAATVWLNCYEEGDMNVAFGGVKLSGSGRDKSRHAMAEFTDLKTTWINYG